MSATNPNTSPGPLKERRRKMTQHVIVNKDEVLSGSDDHYRALCGHTFPVRYGKASWDHSTAEQAEWIHCPMCQSMIILKNSL